MLGNFVLIWSGCKEKELYIAAADFHGMLVKHANSGLDLKLPLLLQGSSIGENGGGFPGISSNHSILSAWISLVARSLYLKPSLLLLSLHSIQSGNDGNACFSLSTLSLLATPTNIKA